MLVDFTPIEKKHLKLLLENELDFLHKEKEILLDDKDELGAPSWIDQFDKEVVFVENLNIDIESETVDLKKKQKKHIKRIIASEYSSLLKRKELLLDDKDELPVPYWIDKLDFEIALTKSILDKIKNK
jgi:hypothetical protein